MKSAVVVVVYTADKIITGKLNDGLSASANVTFDLHQLTRLLVNDCTYEGCSAKDIALLHWTGLIHHLKLIR